MDAAAEAKRTRMSALRAFLMYSSLPEGAIAVSLLLGTYALLGLPPSGPLLGLAFCGTLLVYQADRVPGAAPEDRYNRPARVAWLRQHRRSVRLFSGLALVGAAAALPFLRAATLGLGGALGAVALCYVAPVLPGSAVSKSTAGRFTERSGAKASALNRSERPDRREATRLKGGSAFGEVPPVVEVLLGWTYPWGGRRLKSVWFAKPVAVAGAWAAGAVLMPVVEAGAPVTAAAALLVGYRFLFVLSNVLLADGADRPGDARAGLRTVATEWPAGRVRLLCATALLWAVGGAGVAVALFGASPLYLLDAVGPALLLLAARRAPARAEASAPWFYGFVIDLIVAWPVVTALGAWLFYR